MATATVCRDRHSKPAYADRTTLMGVRSSPTHNFPMGDKLSCDPPRGKGMMLCSGSMGDNLSPVTF